MRRPAKPEGCWIFADKIPIWAMALPASSMKATALFLKSGEWCDVAASLVDEDCPIELAVKGRWAKAPATKAQWALCDGRPSPACLAICEASGISRMLSLRPIRDTGGRRGRSCWHTHHVTVTHSEVGGISTRSTKIYYSWNSNACTPTGPFPTAKDIPLHVQRDASTVVGTTKHNKAICLPPKELRVVPLTVQIHRTYQGQSVYHSGGWLPANFGPRTFITCPSRYQEQDNRWAIRYLADKELLEAFGVSHSHAAVLLDGQYDDWSALVPVESLIAGLKLFRGIPYIDENYLGIHEGGVSKPKRRRRFVGFTDQKAPRPALGLAQSEAKDLSVEAPNAQDALKGAGMADRERKATKSDDAQVPVYLWTDQFVGGSQGKWKAEQASLLEQAMNSLRHLLFLPIWWRLLSRSFFGWMRKKHGADINAVMDRHPGARDHFVNHGEDGGYKWTVKGRTKYCRWHKDHTTTLKVDIEAGRDAIGRATQATWWEWDGGSRPFFWRWPSWYQSIIRDGLPVHFLGKTPLYTTPQSDTKDERLKEMMVKKLQKARRRGYIAPWLVLSLTSFFAVAKGLDDIRMVFDGTKSGLNDATWIPGFWLPTTLTFLRMVTYGTWMSDLDVGEMFLNYVLHESLRAYCGLDLTLYFANEITAESGKLLEAWWRTGMGFKWSPYQAVQGMAVLDETIGGDRHDPNNVFRWKWVAMNLPGSPGYNPLLPWVSKIREDGSLAADRAIFVDDIRTAASSQEDCWRACRVVGHTCSFFGIQDASRKRRQVSQTPGAWAGSVVWTTKDSAYNLVSDDKWAKTKDQVRELRELLTENPNSMPRERLESIRGFLNYVARAYKGIKPYLNGLHLTIDGWRPDRDEDGWRNRRYSEPQFCHGAKHEEHAQCASYRGPEKVAAVPRLYRDIGALEELTCLDEPPLRPVRCKKVTWVLHGFGDASGPGFGYSSQFAGEEEIDFEFGQWTCSVSSEMSSNWRELNNFVEFLERQALKGLLLGTEIFAATDNSVAESAFYKGYSSSPELDKLIVRIYVLEMRFRFRLHLFHVSGKRMISQGTDGLSRGDRGTGSMLGTTIASFLPLHLTAFERSPALKEWVMDVCTAFPRPTLLEPEGWYSTAHDFGNFIWAPPPAAAEVVVEQLSLARHKRPMCFHMVVVPRLMTAYWRKHLRRATDFYFRLEHGPLWDIQDHFEPVLIFICLPLRPHRPNFEKRTEVLEGLQSLLLGARVQEAHQPWFRSSVRKLFVSARGV